MEQETELNAIIVMPGKHVSMSMHCITIHRIDMNFHAYLSSHLMPLNFLYMELFDCKKNKFYVTARHSILLYRPVMAAIPSPSSNLNRFIFYRPLRNTYTHTHTGRRLDYFDNIYSFSRNNDDCQWWIKEKLIFQINRRRNKNHKNFFLFLFTFGTILNALARSLAMEYQISVSVKLSKYKIMNVIKIICFFFILLLLLISFQSLFFCLQ